MKYWKIAFNAQGSRVIIAVVQVGAAKIYVAAVWRRSGKKAIHDETHFTTKIGGKLVWVPVISLCKIYIPSYTFDALLSQTWQFSPPNRGTLLITLIAYRNYLLESLSNFCKPWTLFLYWPQFNVVLYFQPLECSLFSLCVQMELQVYSHISLLKTLPTAPFPQQT
jgi:hypothetical protein